MLDAFASVGAVHFDITHTDRSGAKTNFRSKLGLGDLSRALPAIIDHAGYAQLNVIVRPHSPDVTLIQLDDLRTTDHLAPAVFLALATSPGNFQAWAAIAGREDKDFVRRLRKGVGADPSASGATRVAGSINFKDKYAPNFPRVQIHRANLGRFATALDLDQLGLVAAPEPVRLTVTPFLARARPSGDKRRWPSYERCVDGAPLNHAETGPDISKADFVWCMTALTWGWTPTETADELMHLSAKARDNGRNYAALTARNAALAVQRRKPQAQGAFIHAQHGR